MFGRVLSDIGRTALRFALRLWPLWLVFLAHRFSLNIWRDQVLANQADRASQSYFLLYRAWPSACLIGPILLMLVAVGAERMQRGSRMMAIAGIAGVAVATVLTLHPEWARLSPYFGHARAFDILRVVDPGFAYALGTGIFACTVGIGIMRDERVGRQNRTGLARAPSDNHGHADWLDMRGAQALFPGPDPVYGGIVGGDGPVSEDRDCAVRVGGGRVVFLPALSRGGGSEADGGVL